MFRLDTGSSAEEKQRGTVTAELAIVFPAVTLMLAALAFGAQIGLSQLRFEDAARAAARQAARGEPDAVLTGEKIAGVGAAVSVERSNGFSTVTVSGVADGPLSSWFNLKLSAVAMARTEDNGLPGES